MNSYTAICSIVGTAVFFIVAFILFVCWVAKDAPDCERDLREAVARSRNAERRLEAVEADLLRLSTKTDQALAALERLEGPLLLTSIACKEKS